MKKRFMILPLVLVFCFTFSYQQGEEVAEEPVRDVEADVEALKAMNDEWYFLYNDGDFEKLVSFYYAEDAVQMPDNKPIIKGREAILADYKKTREKYVLRCNRRIAKDVRVSGNMAMVRGNDIGNNTSKDDLTIFYDMKWVAIFERQPDGTWKCICDIGNSNR